MAGYREFAVGEVLTSSNVNEFLMNQSVMVFADEAARDAALGTAVGGTAVLVEGMSVFLEDVDKAQMYAGGAWRPVAGVGTAVPGEGQVLAYGTAVDAWVPVDALGFDSRELVTASNASWPVPDLAHPIVKVTLVGGGGGANNSGTGTPGDGGTTSFGGYGSAGGGNNGPRSGISGYTSGPGFRTNNGGGSQWNDAQGGEVKIIYVDLTGVSTVNITIGAGGGGLNGGGSGDRGEAIIEYKAA